MLNEDGVTEKPRKQYANNKGSIGEQRRKRRVQQQI